jgi:hypothetical protein
LIVTPRGLSGAPITSEDVAALLARKQVLSDQLGSAVGRRRGLAKQLLTATGADKAGLEQRMGVLDARIARLEGEIDENGRLLSSAPAAYIAEQRDAMPDFGPNIQSRVVENLTPVLVVFTLFVLAPIAFSISRLFWKRATMLRSQPALSADSAQRLERMEQAMDAIAIEIERVSEGQRFVTRLLAEGHANAPVGAGGEGKEPVRVSAQSARL